MRYFLRRKLGSLPVPALPVGSSQSTRPRLIEAAAGLANRPATGLLAAAPTAVRLPTVTAGAQKEYLSALELGADDESDGQHGRAAREVGRRAAGMRFSSAITAA
jgi:hypothetical protein